VGRRTLERKEGIKESELSRREGSASSGKRSGGGGKTKKTIDHRSQNKRKWGKRGTCPPPKRKRGRGSITQTKGKRPVQKDGDCKISDQKRHGKRGNQQCGKPSERDKKRREKGRLQRDRTAGKGEEENKWSPHQKKGKTQPTEAKKPQFIKKPPRGSTTSPSQEKKRGQLDDPLTAGDGKNGGNNNQNSKGQRTQGRQKLLELREKGSVFLPQVRGEHGRKEKKI